MFQRCHKFHEPFTRLTAREITYNNFEISLVAFMPNITTNHAITYTHTTRNYVKSKIYYSNNNSNDNNNNTVCNDICFGNNTIK